MTDLLDLEHRLRESVGTIPPAARPLLLGILTSDGERRALEIGTLHATGAIPATVGLLRDAEAHPYLRALLVGMLRETSADGVGMPIMWPSRAREVPGN